MDKSPWDCVWIDKNEAHRSSSVFTGSYPIIRVDNVSCLHPRKEAAQKQSYPESEVLQSTIQEWLGEYRGWCCSMFSFRLFFMSLQKSCHSANSVECRVCHDGPIWARGMPAFLHAWRSSMWFEWHVCDFAYRNYHVMEVTCALENMGYQGIDAGGAAFGLPACIHSNPLDRWKSLAMTAKAFWASLSIIV